MSGGPGSSTADGESQASKRLAAAANVMARDPAALQLRLLQTVVEVAGEKNSTLVMPVPVELLRFFDKMTPAAPAAELSPSLADFGDAEAGADVEAHPGAGKRDGGRTTSRADRHTAGGDDQHPAGTGTRNQSPAQHCGHRARRTAVGSGRLAWCGKPRHEGRTK